jgi:hypothetical protein
MTSIILTFKNELRILVYNKFTTSIIILAILLMMPAICGRSLASGQKAEISQPEYIEKIFNKEKVIDISIEIAQADWNWLLENAAKKEPRNCTITINGTTFYNVAINPKGNSTLTTIIADKNSDRFSFKLDFGKYVKGQSCYGLSKISLNNMYSDKSYMKEYLSYELFDFMGVPTPAFAYANIILNGKNWGLYLAVETIDESFVERTFGSVEGNLYKPESMAMDGAGAGFQERGRLFPNANNPPNPQVGGDPQQEENGQRSKEGFPGKMLGGKGTDLKYTGDSPANYSAIRESAVLKSTTDQEFRKVIAMIKNLNDGTRLEEYLDVDEILRYFAVNTFLVNLDSYTGGMFHNYYLYEKDGVCKILPWDLNMSFAGFSVKNASEAINFPIDNPVKGNLEDAPLIGKLLEVPAYKEMYHKHLKELTDRYIKSGVFQNSVLATDKLINNYVKADTTAFYTYEDYGKAIPVLVAFGRERAESIDAQLKGEQPSTSYGTVATTVDLSVLGSMSMGGERNNQANHGGSMFDISKMNDIMAIINESAGKPLTDEQKQRLKALGVNEDIINNMVVMDNMFGGNSNTKYLVVYGVPIAVLLLGLLLVFKFRRKKFRSY